MNRHLTLFLVFFINCLYSYAQENNPLINSAEAIETGIKLYDEGKYKEALKEYQRVKRGDTNYVLALYKMAMTCAADSQYAPGIRYCEEAFTYTTDPERNPDLLVQYASLIDYSNQPERALKVFDSAIALYPAHVSLYINKGTTLMRMKKYKEAEKVFQQALLINPYSSGAHFKLGISALSQGNIVPACLSLIANLIMEPKGTFANNSILLLNSIAKSKDDIVALVSKRKEEPAENYRLIEQILLSKIALDKQYKPVIELDDPISRQLQVIFEKLSYDENDSDFYMQFYVPLYSNVFKGKKFEYLINHAFSGVDIPAIKEFNRKKKKDIDAYVNTVVEYCNLIRATRELHFAKRSYNGPCYHFVKGQLIGKGISADNGNLLKGAWEFYYTAGNKKAIGRYNDKGEKEGAWKYYYFNGQLKGEELYRNGKQEGPETYYYDNGDVSSRAVYKNGQVDGEHTTYYKGGSVKIIEYYSNGKLNGVKKVFHESGLPQSFETYVNNKHHGTFKTYFTTGETESEGSYVDDLLNGPYKVWFKDGVLSTEAQYEQNKLTGAVKRYYENGKLKSLETYNNGILEGEYVDYFENGQMATRYTNKKGKLSGDVNYYDEDGKLYSTLTFDADIVKAGRYFDKSGKQIGISEMKKGKLDLVIFRPDGTKRMFTPYNAKGEVDGIKVLYFGSGKEKETSVFTKGELNGDAIAYYPNSQKSRSIQYVANKKDGYYTSWYVHGGKQEEGWYKDDKLQGDWLYYNEMGNLVSRTGWLNDERNGIKTAYWPNGKKESETVYDMGSLVEMTEYDTTGKVINHVKLQNGNGKFISMLANGKIYSEGNYAGANIDGPYKYYYFDGTLLAVQYFKKGLADSTYKCWHYGGKISTEGMYKMNEKTGVWKYYRPDGILSQTEQYMADQLHGKRIYYFKNGKPEAEIAYENGERNGLYKKFNEEGLLLFQVRYDDGLPVGYSYLGKNGEPVPEIPLVQGNGKINALFPNGNVSASMEYIDGLLHGTYKLYHANGKPRLENTEVYGSSEGLLQEYHPDGTLRSVYNYLHNNTHGPYKEYNEKGIMVEEGNYYNGSLHGEQRHYDGNGKLKQVRIFYFGQLLSVK